MCHVLRTVSRDFLRGYLRKSPLAASDYLRLARDYHTLMIDRIPVMDYAERNAAKRFITLIDTLYDNRVKLMASAEADPLSLYVASEGNEASEFRANLLAANRDELGILSALPHGHKDSQASGSSTGLVRRSARHSGMVRRTRPGISRFRVRSQSARASE